MTKFVTYVADKERNGYNGGRFRRERGDRGRERGYLLGVAARSLAVAFDGGESALDQLAEEGGRNERLLRDLLCDAQVVVVDAALAQRTRRAHHVVFSQPFRELGLA